MKLLQSIYLTGQPSSVTAQQKGVTMIAGRPHFYEKSCVSKAKQDLLTQLMKYAPDHPYQGPLEIHVLWLFERRALRKREITLTEQNARISIIYSRGSRIH